MWKELIGRLEALGSRTAVIDEGVSYSYRDILDEVQRLEPVLKSHHVRPHDVVILHADFSFLSIATLLALFCNRNIIVPVVTPTDRTLETIRESCRPNHVIRIGEGMEIDAMSGATSGPARAFDRLVEGNASGLVLLSSGSTGAPKAILHDFDSIVREKLGRRARRGTKATRILMFLLFDHIGGINSLLAVLRVGGTAVVTRRRTPDEVCGLIERYEIGVLPTSPTFLNLILIGNYHRHYRLSSLRLITYGTEPMPEELLVRVGAAIPRVRLLQSFGTSETGIATTTSQSSKSTYFRISDPNVQHRLVDGELQLKSNTQFIGYLNYPNDSLTEDSWFRTGDIVEGSADGYMRISGRSKDIINVGGEKVLPLELESILLSSPLIDDCMVYGKANAITGQCVCVDIKPNGDMSKAELRRHVVEFLSGKVERFKMPAKIDVVDAVVVSERFKKGRGV